MAVLIEGVHIERVLIVGVLVTEISNGRLAIDVFIRIVIFIRNSLVFINRTILHTTFSKNEMANCLISS